MSRTVKSTDDPCRWRRSTSAIAMRDDVVYRSRGTYTRQETNRRYGSGRRKTPDRAAAGDGQHPDRGVVQLLLGAAEQLLAGQRRDDLEHLLARVGREREAGAMDGVAHVPLDDRDIEHVLVERGDGEHAEEAVLAEEPSRDVDDADGEVVGLHGAQHAALRAGTGEHEQLGRGVGGLGAERFGDPALPTQHPEPGPLGNQSAAVGARWRWPRNVKCPSASQRSRFARSSARVAVDEPAERSASSRPSASSRSASARAWRAIAGASRTTSRTSCSTSATSASSPAGTRRPRSTWIHDSAMRPGRRRGRVGVGQDGAQLAVRRRAPRRRWGG